jgi:hypothetical protein
LIRLYNFFIFIITTEYDRFGAPKAIITAEQLATTVVAAAETLLSAAIHQLLVAAKRVMFEVIVIEFGK